MIYRIVRASPDAIHSGIKGQKWGRRRYQNEDGTWTQEGQKRYSTDTDGVYGEGGSSNKRAPAIKEKRSEQRDERRKQRRDKGRKVVESHKNENAKKTASQKILNTGMKALNAYMAYESFKDEWA